MKMNFIAAATLSALLPSSVFAVNLTVKIQGLKSNLGSVELTLFNKENESHFPIHPEHALKKEFKSITSDKTVEFTFSGLPDGTYAAFAYHDEDNNKKINSNFMHIPTEGYGASLGAVNKFGPPKFKDAQFAVDSKETQEAKQTINISY